ncbi:MAG: transposase [Sphingomonadales bacterium]|nr:transposase [Sphingomonadales bacterium]
MKPTALLDANVLYSATLRGVLMQLASAGAFRPLWTERIHDEWVAALARDRPDIPSARITRTRSMLVAHLADAMVRGYEDLIDGLTLPDPDDRRVLAGAIRGGAEMVVTCNVRDFPRSAVVPHGIVVLSPDAFVTGLMADDLDTVARALASDRGRLANPPLSGDAYQQTLKTLGIACSMSRVSECYDNAVAERFFWSLKHEWTHHEQLADLEAARLSVFKYIETFYNTERLHQTLGYKSPNQYETDHAPVAAA